MSDEQLILSQDFDDIRVLTVNRPKALNALNVDVIEALDQAIDQIQQTTHLKVVILTGSGDKAFVAGADIKAMSTLSVSDATRFSAYGHRVFERFSQLPQIVIAAVNGFCLGGGCELALACDLVYASEKAVFGQPEVALGLIPGFGGTQRLSRRIGVMRAMDLVVSGRKVKADEAVQMGLALASLAQEGFLESVMEKARVIAKQSFSAVARSKRVIYQGSDASLSLGNQLEIQNFGGCFDTEDAREGMGAFMEKREAKFVGK
jgi:enoyl-CoA hydratase